MPAVAGPKVCGASASIAPASTSVVVPSDSASCCQAQSVGLVCTVPTSLCLMMVLAVARPRVWGRCVLCQVMVPAVARPSVWGRCVLCPPPCASCCQAQCVGPVRTVPATLCQLLPGPECGAGVYWAHHLVPGDGARCWLGCSGCTVLDCGCFV